MLAFGLMKALHDTAEVHTKFSLFLQVEESYIGAEEFCRVVQQQVRPPRWQ